VARNRKRAKERRARRPQPVATPRAEQLNDSRAAGSSEGASRARDWPEELPGPIGHAAPDVELAEAQLAVGRPELAADPGAEPADDDFEPADYDEDGSRGVDSRGDHGGPPSGGGSNLVAAGGGGEFRSGGVALAPPRVGIVSRLVGFLQGSWRELQRVQWPDRRQVAQATGVVLGFVIVAGVFLGLSDYVAQKLINFIING
jgi:preprotein translocase subunit SecE